MALNKHRHIRRNATQVLAGLHDIPPVRDVLTRALNGVPPNPLVEKNEQERQKRKQEKKEHRREEKKKLKAAARASRKEMDKPKHAMSDASSSALLPIQPQANSHTNSFWRSRPTIHIPTVQRSVSVTPSPTSPQFRHQSSPASTPGPSISSSTSRTSSKRPRTPDDSESFVESTERPAISAPPPRKKRSAAKKGWKGWVEGSPPPSQKLINLDAVPVLQDRRLRSGKNFDGIGIGTHGWV